MDAHSQTEDHLNEQLKISRTLWHLRGYLNEASKPSTLPINRRPEASDSTGHLQDIIDSQRVKLEVLCAKLSRMRVMKIQEFRLALPIDVSQYHIGQLYMVSKASLEDTSSSTSGVEVLKNEPYEKTEESSGLTVRGQFTHKKISIAAHMPSWITALVDSQWLVVEEMAWNAYPHCKTVYSCPAFKSFSLSMESMHAAGDSDQSNALSLQGKELDSRTIDNVDIISDAGGVSLTNLDSEMFGSNELGQAWKGSCKAMMTAYKVLRVECNPGFGLQSRVESFIVKTIRSTIVSYHRKLIEWSREWSSLTIVDIRRMEEDTQTKLKAVWAKLQEDKRIDSGEDFFASARNNKGSRAGNSAEQGFTFPPAVKAGRLQKLGDGLLTRGWNLRYVVIRGNTMQYFKDARYSRAREIVDLMGCQVVEGSTEADGEQMFTFTVYPANHRPIVLATTSAYDRKEWVDSFLESSSEATAEEIATAVRRPTPAQTEAEASKTADPVKSSDDATLSSSIPSMNLDGFGSEVPTWLRESADLSSPGMMCRTLIGDSLKPTGALFASSRKCSLDLKTVILVVCAPFLLHLCSGVLHGVLALAVSFLAYHVLDVLVVRRREVDSTVHVSFSKLDERFFVSARKLADDCATWHRWVPLFGTNIQNVNGTDNTQCRLVSIKSRKWSSSILESRVFKKDDATLRVYSDSNGSEIAFLDEQSTGLLWTIHRGIHLTDCNAALARCWALSASTLH